MIDLKLCKKLGLKLTTMARGTKAPKTKNWQKKPVKYKHIKDKDVNIGILHEFSDTVCFDIDDLKAAKKVKLLKREILKKKRGLWYSSGVKNRVKILFKIPKGYDKSIFRVHTLPNNSGQVRCGKGMMDVMVGSKHPSGSTYEWITPTSKIKEIPPLPTVIANLMQAEATATKSITTTKSSGHKFIDVYNEWFTRKGYSLYDEILTVCKKGYTPAGLRSLKRKGSDHRHAVVVYRDSDGIERAHNFSDVVGEHYLNYGQNDPYDLLTKKLGYDEARQYVCSDNKELAELVTNSNDTLYKEGILFDRGCPYLSADVLFPINPTTGEETQFSKIVKSIAYHQEGIYNPDMAFWYSLCFIDYLIGTGYKSIGGNGCEPIYVFTAGASGAGKTKTLHSGGLHLVEIGATGNSVQAGSFMENGIPSSEEPAQPVMTTAFMNKTIKKNVKTFEGLEDLITNELDHGCDILFTQDEYGLKENGTMDNATRGFRAMILDYKTLARTAHVEPRLLAQQQGKKGFKKNGKDTYAVHFNYFTTATVETLKGVIRDEEVGQGYIQRFVGGSAKTPHFNTRKKHYGKRVSDDKQIKKSIKKLLLQIVTISNKSVGYDRAISKNCTQVQVTPEADKYIEDLLEKCLLSDDTLVSKLVENLQPICKLMAICENPKKPVVELWMVKWSHVICSQSVMYFKWLLHKLKLSNMNAVKSDLRDMEIEDMILRYFDKSNAYDPMSGLSRRIVIDNSGIKRVTSISRFTPIWNALIDSGIIVRKKIKNSVGNDYIRYYKKR